MRKVIAVTILFFCLVLIAVYLISEKAAPKMIDVDPAKVHYQK